MIEITRIYAGDDEEFAEKLNKIGGHVLNIERQHDNFYRIIFEV